MFVERIKAFFSVFFEKCVRLMDFFESKRKYFFRKLKVLWHKFYRSKLKDRFVFLRSKIESFEKNVLHKGELRNFVLVRYLVKELLLYFGVAFLFFFMIFFVNQILLLIEEILKKHVPFADTMRLMTYSLPVVISQSAPFATLVGFLMCLGRLMSDNEVLIFRASGLGYRIIAIPVLILGILISVVSFFVNDYLLPIGNINYYKLRREIIASNPGVEMEPNSIKFLNKSIIIIGDVVDSKISDLVFFDEQSGNQQRIIVAGDSEMLSAKKEGVLLQLNMNDSVVASLGTKQRTDFDVLSAGSTTLNILDSQVLDTRTRVLPREMTSYDLGRQIRRFKAMPNPSKYQLNQYRMEFHKKFSNPFGSVFFAILALPLAFIFGKHNGQTICLIFGLVISVLYWAMMILGQMFALRIGIDAMIAMWLPDVLVGTVGVLLYIVLKRK